MGVLKFWETQRKRGNLYLCSFETLFFFLLYFFYITLFLKSKLQSWRVETSPLTTSKPPRCGWTHAWLVELACRPSQFPALALCLCLLSEGQWIRTPSPPSPVHVHTHLAGRSSGAPHSCQPAQPARFITSPEFCIWGLARGKSWFWRREWQAALPYGNSNRIFSYSWTDSNSATVRRFLQEIEEDTEACSQSQAAV